MNASKTRQSISIPPAVVAGAAIYPLIFAIISFSWYGRVEPPLYYSGYMQGDQPTYTAWAREVFERGNGFVYANPYDAAPDAPRIFSNLGYLMLAWMEKLLPGGWVGAWEMFRLMGGIAMALLLYLLIEKMAATRRQALFFWALAMTGGGIAWLLAWIQSPLDGWLSSFSFIEDGRGSGQGYGWWFLDLFRMPLYPLETFYHALLYGLALSYLSKRNWITVLAVALLWWTHPITAAMGTTIIGLAACAEWAAGERRRNGFLLCGLGAVSIVAVAYNRFFIASFPSGASLIEQTFALAQEPLYWQWKIEGWGLFLIAGAAALFLRRARMFLLRDFRGRFVVCWLAAVFLWTHNNWFFARPMQPMHFTRGHFFLGLIFLILIAVRTHEAWLVRMKRWQIACLAGLFLCINLPDNALFSARIAAMRPRAFLLAPHAAELEILDWLNEISTPQTVHSLDGLLSVLIVAHTHHQVIFGDRAVTPFFEQKEAQTQKLFVEGDPALLDMYDVNYLIMLREMPRQMPMAAGLRYFEPAYENDIYVLLKRSRM